MPRTNQRTRTVEFWQIYELEYTGGREGAGGMGDRVVCEKGNLCPEVGVFRGDFVRLR